MQTLKRALSDNGTISIFLGGLDHSLPDRPDLKCGPY
jgi:hypothetical protein